MDHSRSGDSDCDPCSRRLPALCLLASAAYRKVGCVAHLFVFIIYLVIFFYLGL